jgi:hypothetical protein
MPNDTLTAAEVERMAREADEWPNFSPHDAKELIAALAEARGLAEVLVDIMPRIIATTQMAQRECRICHGDPGHHAARCVVGVAEEYEKAARRAIAAWNGETTMNTNTPTDTPAPFPFALDQRVHGTAYPERHGTVVALRGNWFQVKWDDHHLVEYPVSMAGDTILAVEGDDA